jgi:hypothetical protein
MNANVRTRQICAALFGLWVVGGSACLTASFVWGCNGDDEEVRTHHERDYEDRGEYHEAEGEPVEDMEGGEVYEDDVDRRPVEIDRDHDGRRHDKDDDDDRDDDDDDDSDDDDDDDRDDDDDDNRRDDDDPDDRTCI